MFVADLAQPLEIALRRHHHAGGAGDGFDDHCGNGRRIVQGDEPLEFVGELGAVRGQAARESIALDVMRVRQMIDARNHGRRPHLAIGHHAADADAAETHAVIATLAPENRTRAASPFTR